MSHSDQTDYAIPKPVKQWTFSSNHDGIDYWRIFWGGEESAEYILALQEWGKLFDSFLCSRNDYLLFDYLVNTIHKDNEYNENHLIKAFSLCQLFLERHKESELDAKLPQFFELLGPESDMLPSSWMGGSHLTILSTVVRTGLCSMFAVNWTTLFENCWVCFCSTEGNWRESKNLSKISRYFRI